MFRFSLTICHLVCALTLLMQADNYGFARQVGQAKSATDKESEGVGVSYTNPQKSKWRVGVKAKTGAAPLRNVYITIPIPVDWPEQKISKAEEDVPAIVQDIKIRNLDGGVQQLVIQLASIPANSLFDLSMTFNVTVSEIVAPKDTSIFVIPKNAPRELKNYLGVSPQITYRKGKVRSTVKSIVKDKETAWEQVEAIYDWVRDNIDQRDSKATDTTTVFNNRSGNGEDLVGLFVAMCRAHKVPARMVWVDGHQYAEFYLMDSNKNGHWFPCNVDGLREFGSNSEPKVIIQKGDNFRVPEKEDRQKLVRELFKGKSTSKPRVRFSRQLLPAE